MFSSYSTDTFNCLPKDRDAHYVQQMLHDEEGDGGSLLLPEYLLKYVLKFLVNELLSDLLTC